MTGTDILKMKCVVALKELNKRGVKMKFPIGKMSRKQLNGLWGRLCEEMKNV